MKHDYGCLETAANLEKMKLVIIDRWIENVRKNIPAASDESKIILKNGMDKILEKLVDILRLNLINGEELGKSHANHRLIHTRFTLKDLLIEYSLFRETLIDYLYPMGSVHCAHLVHQYIDIIARNSILEFLVNSEETERIVGDNAGTETDSNFEDVSYPHNQMQGEKTAESMLGTQPD